MRGQRRVLGEMVLSRTEGPGRAWFETVVAERVGPAGLAEAFTAAARRVGKRPLAPSGEEAAALGEAGITWPVSGWGVDEAARVALLLDASRTLSPADLVDAVEEAYRHGDNRERQAILRALPLLPEPERFLPVAVDACRSHVQPVFEAIACENPYPAAYFPELNFNQLVLKALFIGVPLARVLGLDGRLTSELSRMAGDYANERRAAGRSVPEDLWRLRRARVP